MWPSALQLTRDECRGILRRLELESYSNVISVFRAQGGLSDSKAKLLEDLRTIFHISQERHRAEARRVANDEQLSTIAEAISGPNTWQEWSREGRRTYPLLPRVPPQTALSIVANNVAAEITNENSKLPYPTETAAVAAAAAVAAQPQEFSTSNERGSDAVPIVTSDPLQPEIPEIRKNLKRNFPTDALTTTKKRIISESSSPSATANETPLSPTTQIRKLYHNHSKTQSARQRNALAKKATNSPAKRVTAAAKKRLTSGDSMDSNKTNTTVFQAVSSSAPVATLESVETSPPRSISQDTVVVVEPQEAATPASVTTTPQIATSKKDISKNLSKLNLITSQPVQQQQTQQQQQHQEKLSDCKTEKLSTPVQKYIVEERTPMLVSSNPTLPSHLLEKQQVITSKVKPMTAVVPTPLTSASKAKVTSVKTIKNADIVCSSPVSSQPQVFNVIDSSTPPYVPHTPPAIINISSKFEPEHGKVLTTKLLPLMLSSGSKLEPSNGSPAHLKNITHPSPSATTTVFRKPNIIKGSMPMKQKIQITSQQIISPPTVASLKMSPHLHLKGVPGGGPIHNRKSVKIFSSPNGKMFIQSADSSGKPMAKVNTIVTGQKGQTGHIVNANPAPGRIAIQKVQIIPAPSANTAGSGAGAKPIAITKPNMIFMPMSSTTPAVKGLPLVKGNKFTTVLPTTIGQDSTTVTASAAKSNVFVIGAVQSSPQTILSKDMQGFNNRNNMITEDTPVDIITTPIIVDVDSIDTQSIKPTETIDLTTIADNSTPPPARGTTTAPSTVLQSRLGPETCYVELTGGKSSSSNRDIDNNASSDGQVERGDNVAMVIGVTDWEMELDQEANKARALNAQKSQKTQHSSVESLLMGSGGEECGSSADEHFVDDDVIEEQEETEEETDDGCETAAASKGEEGTKQNMSHEASQHHHHPDDDEDEPIEVGDEQMKSEGDVIQYDESYESANDDLDENIAIEYVDDDQDGYEEKIDSTSNDRKETMECNSNIVLIKQGTHLTADSLDSSENKSQSSNDCIVSVEEISSTTQQNITGSQDEP